MILTKFTCHQNTRNYKTNDNDSRFQLSITKKEIQIVFIMLYCIACTMSNNRTITRITKINEILMFCVLNIIKDSSYPPLFMYYDSTTTSTNKIMIKSINIEKP